MTFYDILQIRISIHYMQVGIDVMMIELIILKLTK